MTTGFSQSQETHLWKSSTYTGGRLDAGGTLGSLFPFAAVTAEPFFDMGASWRRSTVGEVGCCPLGTRTRVRG